MGSNYSGNHTVKDHVHTDIKTCNTEEPQQKYRLGTVGNGLLGVLKHVLLGPNPPSAAAVIKTFAPHEDFLAHQ